MTKTVVVVGDSHFCETSRFEECIRLHQEIADWVAANKPDLLVHCGDVFERKSTPNERLEAASFLQLCAAHCPVHVVRGNHDAERDLTLMSCITSRNSIMYWEHPATVDVAGIRLCLLPWPRKAQLLAALGDEVSQEQAGQVAQNALRDVLRGMRHEVDGPTLFAGHVMVRGSVTSHGQPLVGCDMELGLEDLALVGADAYALGHIHMRQEWDIDGAPCFYPGSPRRTAYGEVEEKGFTVLRFRELKGAIGGSVWGARAEFVELSATKMALIETYWYDDGKGFADDLPFELPGAEVRFRYRVDSDRREEAQAAANEMRRQWLERGSVAVKIEPEVIANTRLRAPEVAKAATLREQLEAHWRSKSYDPGARRESLLCKLSTLEGESL